MRQLYPGERALLVLRLRCVMLAVPAAFFCGAVGAFSILVCWIMAILFSLVFFFAFFFYLPRMVSSCTIRANREIAISYGVFLTKTSIVPCDRVLWMERIQTPLTRRLDLCSLHLIAARNKVRLWLVSEEDSEVLWNLVERESGGEQHA